MNNGLIEDAKRGGYISEIMRKLSALEKSMRDVLSRKWWGPSDIREKLTAARTYYVRTDGSDSNNGLTNSASGAFLTIQHAVDIAAGLDTGIYDVTIQVGNGTTYAEQVTLKAPVGSGGLIIQGDIATPANVTLDGNFTASTPGVIFTVQGFKLKRVAVASAFGALYSDRDSLIQFKAITFDTGYTWQIYATGGGKVYAIGNYTVSGGCARHYFAEAGGSIIRNAPGVSLTVLLSGTPAWSSAMAYCVTGGNIIINQTQVTMSGAATGKRYDCQTNGVINTAGGGINYFPGNVAGTTDGFGVYA